MTDLRRAWSLALLFMAWAGATLGQGFHSSQPECPSHQSDEVSISGDHCSTEGKKVAHDDEHRDPLPAPILKIKV
jgi:hypothetical protein